MASKKSNMTVEELVRRATRGQKFNRHVLFRPSLAYYIFKDPFWVWCEYHAPREEAVNETTRYDELRLRQGLEHEENWVKQNYPDSVKIEPDFGFKALKNTFLAMLQGVPAIYQPQLWDLGRENYGKGDLLIRDNSRDSDLGPFHYRLLEIKRSRSLQEYHILPAAFYNQTLGLLQGYVPDELTIVLKESCKSVPYSGHKELLEGIVRSWKTLRNGDLIPEPARPPGTTSSPWRIYGNKKVEAEKDLLLLAGIQKREREKLRKAGVRRIDELWDLRLEEVCEIIGNHYGAIAHWVAQAYKRRGPILKSGRELAIPRAKRLLYFDFETSDDVHPSEPPHIYLIGCWDGMRDQYVKFLARGAEDEGRIFEEFLDYTGDVQNTRLYHWTDFEFRQVQNVMRRWPTLAGRLEKMISCCVDLKKAIQEAVYLLVPTFSIKSVAPALGFHWRQQAIGAYQSMVCYWEYLEGGDESAIAKAIIYNEDDCLAMWHVDQELNRRLARE